MMAEKSRQNLPFITCGMYAFTPELRLAWQALFDRFSHLTADLYHFDDQIVFENNESVLRDQNLFLGHTCGYPLMKKLQKAVVPICTPVFDVEGCEDKLYSSAFITSVGSDIQSLDDCKHRVVAFNGRDSNSGMNVLRNAIAPLAEGKPYFSRTIETGSHKNSVIEVGSDRADLAAIDSVSLALIAEAWPELVAGVRVIGYSAKTCGLPFVLAASKMDISNRQMITQYLNLALHKLPIAHQKSLRIKDFADVELSDYEGILALEHQAESQDYPNLI